MKGYSITIYLVFIALLKNHPKLKGEQETETQTPSSMKPGTSVTPNHRIRRLVRDFAERREVTRSACRGTSLPLRTPQKTEILKSQEPGKPG